MANVFTNSFNSSVGITNVVVYEPNSSVDYATVIGCTLANILTTKVKFDLLVKDVDNTEIYIIKDADLETGTGQVPIGGEQKLVLKPNQQMIARSDTPDSVDVTVSILEITE